jgi:hypothetical protein
MIGRMARKSISKFKGVLIEHQVNPRVLRVTRLQRSRAASSEVKP